MASIALNVAKVPEHMVRRMGAWQDARMVGRYGHLADEELRKAELAVARIVAGPPAKAAKRRPRARA
jgi:hypothetical protein